MLSVFSLVVICAELNDPAVCANVRGDCARCRIGWQPCGAAPDVRFTRCKPTRRNSVPTAKRDEPMCLERERGGDNMKTQRSLGFVFSVPFAVLILSAASAAAQAERIQFEGTDHYIAWTSPGTWRCPGSQPTGTFPPCPYGSRAHLRDAVLSGSFSSDELGAADVTVHVNKDYSADYTGRGWGTFTMQFTGGPAIGSSLEGTWTSSTELTESGYVHTVSWIGFFSGGDFDGAIAKAKEVAQLTSPDPAGATAITMGRLLDPEDE